MRREKIIDLECLCVGTSDKERFGKLHERKIKKDKILVTVNKLNELLFQKFDHFTV